MLINFAFNPSYKLIHPKVGILPGCAILKITDSLQHHAFARYILPVKSTVFSEQEWPNKKHENNNERPPQSTTDGEKKQRDMTLEERKFYDKLVEEITTIRQFQNNDGQPVGDLKTLSDKDVLVQLESGVSLEDQ